VITFTLSIVTPRATDTPRTWYLRSYQDKDTHRAAALAADGTVHAMCGLTFRPVAHPLDGVPACLSSPPDVLQICPACQLGDAR
jgi:hypothetical protein